MMASNIMAEITNSSPEGPTPKAMGSGPMKITMPPLLLTGPDMGSNNIETKPMNIIAKPMMKMALANVDVAQGANTSLPSMGEAL